MFGVYSPGSCYPHEPFYFEQFHGKWSRSIRSGFSFPKLCIFMLVWIYKISPLLVLRREPAQQSPPTTIALLTRSFSCWWAFLFFAATKVAMFFKITRQPLNQSCETLSQFIGRFLAPILLLRDQIHYEA
jgi:hypothetical protein